MQFHNLLEELLSGRGRVAVLRLLTRCPKNYTTREISRYTRISIAGVIKIMGHFEKHGIVTSIRVGRSILWDVNTRCSLYALTKEMVGRWDGFMGDELCDAIRSKIRSDTTARKRVREAILYGSVARGDEKPNSDVDLLLVVTKRGKWLNALSDKLVGEVLGRYGNTLSILITEDKSKLPQKLRQNIAREGIRVWSMQT